MQVYLDNNATTRIDDAVVDAMLPFLSERYGNPSSMHTFGGQVATDIYHARTQIAKLINADPDEIIFTGSGTEGNNTAIRSALEAYPGKRHVVTTMVEHPSVKGMGDYLEKNGYRVTRIPVDSTGNLNLEMLENSLTPDTAIVSIMWANNETGVLFPIPEIARLCASRNILFHTDAVQATGKIPIDMRDVPADYLSMSAHKIHGPKGIGVLFVRKNTPFHPLMIGGHQEHGRRAGTENAASIIGFGKAAELSAAHLAAGDAEMAALRDHLQDSLTTAIPNAFVNGLAADRLPNTLSISFEFIEGEAILLMLNEFQIQASSGSACTSGSLEPSHVLRAMGVPYTAAHGTIRFSLSRFTTRSEIDKIIEILPGIVKQLRAMSPYWSDAN